MTTLLLLAPVLLPLAAAAGHALAGWRRATAWAGIATTAVVLADAAALAVVVTRDGPASTAGGLLRADALSAWHAARRRRGRTAGLLGQPRLPAPTGHRRPTRGPRRYGILLQLFLAAMAVAVLAGNLGVLWVAVEATTIVTAFLVGHHRTRAALEAAWKYVVICSVGDRHRVPRHRAALLRRPARRASTVDRRWTGPR